MKLLFADTPTIDGLTFRRLMLLGSELSFVERPSILLADNYLTGGVYSNVAELIPKFDLSPIKLKIGQPPTTVFASNFYQEYYNKDLENPLFIDTVINGIQANRISHLIFDSTQNKNEGEYKDFKNWILKNRDKLKEFDFKSVERPDKIFKVTNLKEAYFAFSTILSEQSLRVTSVINIAENFRTNPVSINPYLNLLINQRVTNRIYTGEDIRSRQLGLRLFEAMIPDEALVHLSIDDLLKFRKKTKSYYDAWEIESNRLESQLINGGFDFPESKIQKIIDTEINPKLFEYKNEIRRVRDEMFSKIMKLVKNVGISVITGGTLSTIDIPSAIYGFIATNLKTPELTDEIIDAHFKLRDIKRSNGLTYLMKVNQLINTKGSP